MSEAVQLNCAGQPIRPGEGYGGRPEQIPETRSQKLAKAAAKQQHGAVTEGDMCEVFGNDSYTLTLTEAAKLLEQLSGAHRTSCYRALKMDGPFGRHLHTDCTTLTWR